MIFEFDDFDVRDRFYSIDEKNQKINLYFDALPQKKQSYFIEMFDRAFIYHDSALDGMVLSHEEISSVLGASQQVRAMKGRIVHECANHRELLLWLRMKIDRTKSRNGLYQCDIITFKDVIEMHEMLYNKIPRKDPGKLRKIIPLHAAYFHTVEDPKTIERSLKELCEQTADPDFRSQHPLNQATLFHHKFMSIFPFLNGSGKIGRLFMNGFLLQGGYQPVVIHASDRQRYYETLKTSPEDLRDLVLDSIEASLDAQFKLINQINASDVGFKGTSRHIL